MDQYAQDALVEIYDVLSGLRHFLSAVGDVTTAATKVELGVIEDQLVRVTNHISSLHLPDSKSPADLTSLEVLSDNICSAKNRRSVRFLEGESFSPSLGKTIEFSR